MSFPGPAEIAVILLIALIVFGPKRLPEVGRQVGSAMRELRKMQDAVKSELDGVLNPDFTPAPNLGDTEPTETAAIEDVDHPALPSPTRSDATDDGFEGPPGSFL
jgi:TatA/E family protein of Tat protein translocase